MIERFIKDEDLREMVGVGFWYLMLCLIGLAGALAIFAGFIYLVRKALGY